MSDKIIRCSEQIFRPADANSYCQKLAGHTGPHQFLGVEAKPVLAGYPVAPLPLNITR